MNYGLSLPNGGEWGDARTLGELARLAEQSGWDGVFLEDYIVWQGHPEVPTYDPWVALAAMALQTQRVRLGTLVTALPRRRPWKVARETVTLDHLTNGRLILGVGIGDSTLDKTSFGAFGETTDAKARAKMLDEALEVLTGLWSGEPFSFKGRYYHVKNARLLPRPMQSPRIPIWVGGGFPLKGPTRRALRWDGACMYRQGVAGELEQDWTPKDLRKLKTMAERKRDAGQPFDIAVGGRHRGDDWDKERAFVCSLEEAGATWWVEYIPPSMGGLEVAREIVSRGPLRIE